MIFSTELPLVSREIFWPAHSSEKPTSLHERIQYTEAPGWTILVRLLVGLAVFFPEGLQKLMFADVLGAGRFALIGIPYPDIMGPFVGVVEIVCGVLIIFGLYTRLAAIPLIIIMVVALVSTKLPILLGQDFWMFHLPANIQRVGFWAAEHEARADLTMLLGSIFLLIVGGGRWSIDAWQTGTAHAERLHRRSGFIAEDARHDRRVR